MPPSGNRSTASHRPSKAASSDAPRNHHSAHYRWWTLSRTLNPRQCGQAGRLPFADGRLDIRWKGLSLPYSAFDDNQQHVTHAAITENKRLSEVLAYAKALQDAAPPNVNTVGKQKSRYEPTGKKSPGRRSWLDKRAERRAEEAAQVAGQVSDV